MKETVFFFCAGPRRARKREEEEGVCYAGWTHRRRRRMLVVVAVEVARTQVRGCVTARGAKVPPAQAAGCIVEESRHGLSLGKSDCFFSAVQQGPALRPLFPVRCGACPRPRPRWSVMELPEIPYNKAEYIETVSRVEGRWPGTGLGLYLQLPAIPGYGNSVQSVFTQLGQIVIID